MKAHGLIALVIAGLAWTASACGSGDGADTSKDIRLDYAYYNPLMNEIVFPAAILQYPFFDEARDAAANYGGIGAVIGHEIGHGFDDQGSRYDGTGKLQDWWTDADRAAFEVRTASLIEQYNELAPAAVPEQHVNGALTIGENIGDLGGLGIAYDVNLFTYSDGSPVTSCTDVANSDGDGDGFNDAEAVGCKRPADMFAGVVPPRPRLNAVPLDDAAIAAAYATLR